ncbi:MAG TPA: hypothetical protein VFW62_11135, partial [bacterium]|nr:hypothetical protein [bacterium]
MGTDISNKFALIVNGDQEPRHLDNVDRAVAAFRQEGPYEISVLSPEQPSAPVEHYSEASDAGLERLLSGLGGRIRAEDLLSVYVTGHGGLDKDTGEACIALPSTCPTLDSFAQGLNALPFKRRLVVMDQCKGGDGLRPFAKPNSVVVTLGGPGENVQCQTFSPFFWSQQARDANGDGLLTIEERFRYAIEEGMPPSKPQFYQPGK